jgi:hypothetical protein
MRISSHINSEYYYVYNGPRQTIIPTTKQNNDYPQMQQVFYHVNKEMFSPC